MILSGRPPVRIDRDDGTDRTLGKVIRMAFKNTKPQPCSNPPSFPENLSS
jgi:hypothetical protein